MSCPVFCSLCIVFAGPLRRQLGRRVNLQTEHIAHWLAQTLGQQFKTSHLVKFCSCLFTEGFPCSNIPAPTPPDEQKVLGQTLESCGLKKNCENTRNLMAKHIQDAFGRASASKQLSPLAPCSKKKNVSPETHNMKRKNVTGNTEHNKPCQT